MRVNKFFIFFITLICTLFVFFAIEYFAFFSVNDFIDGLGDSSFESSYEHRTETLGQSSNVATEYANSNALFLGLGCFCIIHAVILLLSYFVGDTIARIIIRKINSFLYIRYG